jgi:hypothetical protein
VDIGGIGNSGSTETLFDYPGDLIHLRHRSDFLGKYVSGYPDPNRQPRTIRTTGICRPCEYGSVRRKHSFRATGPYKRHSFANFLSGSIKTIRQKKLVGQRGESARKIVRSTIAFCLSDYRNNFGGIDLLGINQSRQLRHIIWSGHRHSVHTDFHDIFFLVRSS